MNTYSLFFARKVAKYVKQIVLVSMYMFISFTLFTACGLASGPEKAVREAFEIWAQQQGTPYQNPFFETLIDDGAYATIRIIVEIKPNEKDDWIEMETELEVRNMGGEWIVDIPWVWTFQVTQSWLTEWLGPLSETKIVCSGGSAIYSFNADGTNVQILGMGYFPKFSPDGSRIVYMTDYWDESSIYSVNSQGGNPIIIADKGLHPSWSPNGDKIIYVSKKDGIENIFVVNSDGNDAIELTKNQNPSVHYYSPVWLPDGSRISYISISYILSEESGIYLMDNSGENITKLYYAGSFISWSPNGEYLLTSRGMSNILFQIDGAGNSTQHSFNAISAAWSPDGTKIAIITTISEGGLGKYRVALTNHDGSNLVPLPSDEFLCINGISWSP